MQTGCRGKRQTIRTPTSRRRRGQFDRIAPNLYAVSTWSDACEAQRHKQVLSGARAHPLVQCPDMYTINLRYQFVIITAVDFGFGTIENRPALERRSNRPSIVKKNLRSLYQIHEIESRNRRELRLFLPSTYTTLVACTMDDYCTYTYWVHRTVDKYKHSVLIEGIVCAAFPRSGAAYEYEPTMLTRDDPTHELVG